MFKALTRLTASLGAPRKAAPQVQAGADEIPILVSQSAFDAYPKDPHPLVDGVIDYVNILTGHGRYTRNEVPARAMQAFHMDYYLAQVNNGGHAQFIRNTGANMDFTLADIRAGMQAACVADHLLLVDALEVWLEAYPEEAAKQTGFEGGIAPEMKNLDDMFFALEKDGSLRDTIAGLIAAAPDLVVVADDHLDDARSQACAANPLRPLRDRIFTILNYQAQIADKFHGAVGLAAGQALPCAPVLKIFPGKVQRLDGAEKMVFIIATTKGRRWGVLDDAGVAIHTVIEHEVPKAGQPGEAADGGRTMTRTSSELGDRLSFITHAQAKAVSGLAEELKVGTAIDLLLSRMLDPPKIDRITIRHGGPDADGLNGMVLLLTLHGGKSVMKVVVTEIRAVLLHEPEQREIARVERSQIDAHAAEFAPERLLDM